MKYKKTKICVLVGGLDLRTKNHQINVLQQTYVLRYETESVMDIVVEEYWDFANRQKIVVAQEMNNAKKRQLLVIAWQKALAFLTTGNGGRFCALS